MSTDNALGYTTAFGESTFNHTINKSTLEKNVTMFKQNIFILWVF